VDDSRRLVYISGAPGSGKTSLAIPLAAELGYTLLAQDKIKETLHDALSAPAPGLAWSRRLGAAAMELLWPLAADAQAVVVEANFRPGARYNARITHPVHVVTTLSVEATAEYDRPMAATHGDPKSGVRCRGADGRQVTCPFCDGGPTGAYEATAGFRTCSHHWRKLVGVEFSGVRWTPLSRPSFFAQAMSVIP
jgi:hypothetical protein